MKRFNTLGLLAVAALAIAAFVGTTSASALKSGSFTATSGAGKKIETTVAKQHVFTITGSTVTCNKVEYAGSTEGAETTSQSVTPSYNECTAFGLSAKVTNNNCKIKLTATTDKENGHSEAHLEGTNCSITIHAEGIFNTTCHVVVTPQTIKGIHYVNTASPEGVIVQITSGATMSAEVLKSASLCPLTEGSHTTASYTGEENVTASGGVTFMETASAGAP